MSTMQCDVVSVKESLYSGTVTMLIAKGAGGELGIMPGHAPLVTLLKPGAIRVLLENGTEELIYVSGGVLEVQPHVVTVLADTAVRADNLDEAAILEERKKLRAYTLKKKTTPKQKFVRNEHIVALEHLLSKEKIYLDSKLTLETVARKLNLSTSHLSRILKAELQTNFTEYLNSYRIKEAKDYLQNPEFSKYTIVAVGLEAGFNSKSAFFHVFKKTTGQTPLEFKKEHLRS